MTVLCLLQILELSQHDKAITIYYHPNSFGSTQSIRSSLANCWRFTVALDTPEVRYIHTARCITTFAASSILHSPACPPHCMWLLDAALEMSAVALHMTETHYTL